MLSMYNKPKLNESKYGYKFDQYKQPFRTDKRMVIDNNGKELAEFANIELAKEFVAILNDLQKMRELAERFSTIWK